MSFGDASDQTRLEELTETVANIWADVLEIERSAIDPHESDFFALGGYSLLVLQSISRLLTEQGISEEDGQELEGLLLNELFEKPTAAAQAECLLRNVPVQA
ncbi:MULTISPECIES: phosphopantetheine-binding protein [Streptomyces]|uniref:phosphopantetheine-binding protein n=1 Tax=Streptomyces TaxID=1883 RepID=UPI0022721F45|nr:MULTISPECIES: phosphopantetheine-binding protein [unclassified Streptomyces]MCY0944114.1 phosphopantetheine-binding protein [Streptomyces sp. H34-AA3]MCY0950419.1 phosphopantetheine-binding protein [Streptomyces sp. H27-S2]MCZ4087645.1 phosphopantetheine-binding protein [Streptomyces sp. H34-S5]